VPLRKAILEGLWFQDTRRAATEERAWRCLRLDDGVDVDVVRRSAASVPITSPGDCVSGDDGQHVCVVTRGRASPADDAATRPTSPATSASVRQVRLHTCLGSDSISFDLSWICRNSMLYNRSTINQNSVAYPMLHCFDLSSICRRFVVELVVQQAVRQIHNKSKANSSKSTTSCMQQSASLTASCTTCCRTDPQLIEVMESDTY